MDRKRRIVSKLGKRSSSTLRRGSHSAQLRKTTCSLRSSRRLGRRTGFGKRWPGERGCLVVNAVVAEFYVLDHCMVAASRCDASMKAMMPSRPCRSHVLRMGSRLSRSLRRRFDLLDCVGIGVGVALVMSAIDPDSELKSHGAFSCWGD